ncbi:hypothetical protein CP967_08665 [Streptomyces nitrosporeus]|uniref:Uncharacterized protein n=1 Tax=Streptomyces nitrosporeus TaxID=28894 RepID=A0A5J6F8V5_9ACTN|nr:hypothetical protein [Streptomyces nitrosporeus]QEU72034.1 hypothetical protein CP967_08665 [Streptomyces nitrosporeus]GGY81105.1 hypothetical protein GCM10010327_09670 [Streptomyces nitrosporeus]
MIISYTPAGGDPERYDARTLRTSEASIVARTIDKTWPQVREGLAEDDLDAMRAVVWVLRKRQDPTLRYGDFDPGVDELTTLYDKDEIEDWVDAGFALGLADPDVTVDQVVVALSGAPKSAADPDHARAYIEKCRAEAEAGKAPAGEAVPEMADAPEQTSSSPSTSRISGPSTSDSSPTS